MKIGYARVSTEDQQLDVQRSALSAEGCAKIFAEKITGASYRLRRTKDPSSSKQAKPDHRVDAQQEPANS